MLESRARYHLTGPDLDELAGGFENQNAARVLDEAAYTRRQLLLQEVLDRTTFSADSGAPRMRKWGAAAVALERVRDNLPAIYEEVLTLPSTGLWLGHVLRQLSASEEAYQAGYAKRQMAESYVERYPTPIRTHLQHLASLAATAAIKAGVHCRLEVPTYGDTVLLPMLGRARLPKYEGRPGIEAHLATVEVDRGGNARIHARGKTIELSGSSSYSSDWQPCRFIEAGVGPNKVVVLLDDLDHFGKFELPRNEGVDVRLDEKTAMRWQTLFREAWELLTTDHPEMAQEIKRLRSIVPMPPSPQRFLQLGASNTENGLSVRLSLPSDPTQFALGLVHEYAHNKFHKIINFLDFYKVVRPPQEDRTIYSPWRTDPRPIRGHFNGTYASMCMWLFWESRCQIDRGSAGQLAQLEFNQWQLSLPGAVRVLHDRRHELTPGGQRFLAGISSRVSKLQKRNTAAHEEVKRLARLADIANDGQWRAFHLPPATTSIEALAASWPSIEASVHIDKHATQLNPIGILARFKVSLPKEFEEAYGKQTVHEIVPEASPGDIALVAGDTAIARQLYICQLQQNPDDITSMVGLGLAETQLNPNRAASMLCYHPHVIRALNRQLAARTGEMLHPLQVAAWWHDRLPGRAP